jgi:hypothetical protein
VRKIMEFYYRKGGKELQVRSLPGGMEVSRAGEKRGQDFILGRFYITLNMEMGKKICVIPHFKWPSGHGEELGELLHTPMLLGTPNP